MLIAKAIASAIYMEYAFTVVSKSSGNTNHTYIQARFELYTIFKKFIRMKIAFQVVYKKQTGAKTFAKQNVWCSHI